VYQDNAPLPVYFQWCCRQEHLTSVVRLLVVLLLLLLVLLQ